VPTLTSEPGYAIVSCTDVVFCFRCFCLRLSEGGRMPKSCSVGLCKNHAKKEPSRRFFNFPSIKNATRRALWAARCGRKDATGASWSPKPCNKSVYVCSAHFITGQQQFTRAAVPYLASLVFIESLLEHIWRDKLWGLGRESATRFLLIKLLTNST